MRPVPPTAPPGLSRRWRNAYASRCNSCRSGLDWAVCVRRDRAAERAAPIRVSAGIGDPDGSSTRTRGNKASVRAAPWKDALGRRRATARAQRSHPAVYQKSGDMVRVSHSCENETVPAYRRKDLLCGTHRERDTASPNGRYDRKRATLAEAYSELPRCKAPINLRLRSPCSSLPMPARTRRRRPQAVPTRPVHAPRLAARTRERVRKGAAAKKTTRATAREGVKDPDRRRALAAAAGARTKASRVSVEPQASLEPARVERARLRLVAVGARAPTR